MKNQEIQPRLVKLAKSQVMRYRKQVVTFLAFLFLNGCFGVTSNKITSQAKA